MFKKIVGVSIAVFCLLFLTPFFVYADDPEPVPEESINNEIESNVTDTPVSEPESVVAASEGSETDIVVLDPFALKATEDFLNVLDDNNVVYVPELHDEVYYEISLYIHSDNTEYITEVIRSDLHDIIISNTQPLSYTDEARKAVDKQFDDIFVVSQDNQDMLFVLYVIIGLLSLLLTLQFLSYFVR